MPPDDSVKNLFEGPLMIFQSEAFVAAIFWVKLFSIVLSAALTIGIVVIFRKNWALERRIKMPKKNPVKPIKTKVALDVWMNIIKRAENGTEQDLAFAIIEADKLVDAVLKGGGFPGDTMAERLKRIDENQLRSINLLWRAHKERNNIVHTPGYHISLQQAKDILADYQKVLEELEVI